VGDVVERVTRRRVDYVASALIELGVAPAEAHRRAVAGVAVVLGIEQLGRGGAESVFGGRDELRRIVLDVVFGPEGSG
jgi:hypothetical protein